MNLGSLQSQDASTAIEEMTVLRLNKSANRLYKRLALGVRQGLMRGDEQERDGDNVDDGNGGSEEGVNVRSRRYAEEQM